MNTAINQTFDWSRFTATVRKEVVENKRMLLFTIIGIYGLLTMVMILGNLIAHQSDFFTDAEFARTPAEFARAPQMLVGSIASFVACISASLAFKDLKTKPGRTHYLTSPSSTLEKFLAGVLIYAVGMMIAFFVCAQLADLTRIAALWWFRSDTFFVPGPINFLNSVAETVRSYDEIADAANITSYMSLVMWVGLIANMGLFLMGSVLWPRLSALKTFAALYAVEFVVFLIAVPAALCFGDMEAFAQWFMEFVTGGTFSTSMFIWVIVQAIVFWALAWYLFKRKDVVSLKWWK